MPTPQPSAPDDPRTCRKCGFVYARKLPRCPACSAYPGRRRRSSSQGAWYRGISERIRKALPWFQGNRIYFLYVGGGLLAGAALMPLTMFLAELSRPEGWREARMTAGFTLMHFLDPFLAAGQTLLRWAYYATFGLVVNAWEGLIWALRYYPSATIMAILGAIGGFLAAHLRKRRSKKR